MAWTQSDLDAIDSAIAQGVAEVRFADRTIRYRSIEDLLRAREVVIHGLSVLTGAVSRKQIRAFTTMGW